MKNRIKKLRQEMGLTQIELANKLKVSQSTLSYWEKGTYDADNESLKKLADLFSCTVDYLICRSDIKYSVFSEGVFGDTLTDREKQIILAYRKNPSMQGAVDTLLGIQQKTGSEIASDMASVVNNCEDVFSKKSIDTK